MEVTILSSHHTVFLSAIHLACLKFEDGAENFLVFETRLVLIPSLLSTVKMCVCRCVVGEYCYCLPPYSLSILIFITWQCEVRKSSPCDPPYNLMQPNLILVTATSCLQSPTYLCTIVIHFPPEGSGTECPMLCMTQTVGGAACLCRPPAAAPDFKHHFWESRGWLMMAAARNSLPAAGNTSLWPSVREKMQRLPHSCAADTE